MPDATTTTPAIPQGLAPWIDPTDPQVVSTWAVLAIPSEDWEPETMDLFTGWGGGDLADEVKAVAARLDDSDAYPGFSFTLVWDGQTVDGFEFGYGFQHGDRMLFVAEPVDLDEVCAGSRQDTGRVAALGYALSMVRAYEAARAFAASLAA